MGTPAASHLSSQGSFNDTIKIWRSLDKTPSPRCRKDKRKTVPESYIIMQFFCFYSRYNDRLLFEKNAEAEIVMKSEI